MKRPSKILNFFVGSCYEVKYALCRSSQPFHTLDFSSEISLPPKKKTNKKHEYMGVSKNGGTPKWMVIMENPIKIDDLGVPLFLETPIYTHTSNHEDPHYYDGFSYKGKKACPRSIMRI